MTDDDITAFTQAIADKSWVTLNFTDSLGQARKVAGVAHSVLRSDDGAGIYCVEDEFITGVDSRGVTDMLVTVQL